MLYIDTYINAPGKVYVRYLKPILPHEVSNREQMARLVSVYVYICIYIVSPYII
jgi:hypothetical protein